MRRLRWKTDPTQLVKRTAQTSKTFGPSGSTDGTHEWKQLAAHAEIWEALQIANTKHPGWWTNGWELQWRPRQGWEVRASLPLPVTS